MAAVGTQLRSSSSNGGVSRLSMMQAKLQQKLMLEKESRLLEMAARQDAEREDIINRVTKTSANSLSSSMSSLNSSSGGQGRVRRMFEERRNNPRGYNQSPKGYDKSYPLDPVKRDGGRPANKAAGRGPGRGMSMDRAPPQYDDVGMGRSRSQAPLHRANRGDNRLPKPPRGPPAGRGFPTHHKSTSSLLEGHNAYNGSSRGPSPLPPSSTKSSPGPRSPPIASSRRSYNPRKPLQPRSDNKFLGVNGNGNDNRSRSPTPTPRESNGKGFLSKLGFNKKNENGATSPRPAPSKKSQLSVSDKSFGGSSAPNTPQRSIKSPVPDHLRACKICSRNFAPDRLEKHQEICAKTKTKAKKRKVFDPVKMRTKGTEAEKFVARGDHLKENKKIKAKKNNWRKKHEDFIKTVRAAKGMEGYVAPPIDTSDYTECPYCGRKFNEKAADRHIPRCKDISSNKTGPQQQKAPPRRKR